MLPMRQALTCLWRTTAINAAITTRGMQQIGLSYVLAPALRHLHRDRDARNRAFARYSEHANTHPFMLPSYAGLLISMEGQIAQGKLPEAVMGSLRQTLATTLSALGDGFFSGALRTTWALITIMLLLEDMVSAACAFTLLLLFLLMFFRAASFFFCLRNGITALGWLRKLDLITWTSRIKIFNALLCGLTLWIMLNTSSITWPWIWQVCALCLIPVAAWLVGRAHIPRSLIWLLALGIFILIEEGIVHV